MTTNTELLLRKPTVLSDVEVTHYATCCVTAEDAIRAAEQKILERALTQPTPPASQEQANECARSHPHEDMSPMCELRAQIARLTNENTRLKASQEQADTVPLTKYNELLMQEHALSHAYVRLRHILGAMDPPRGSDAKAVWAYVEGVAQQIVAASQEQAQQPSGIWRLWMCTQETGHEFLHREGSEADMNAELTRLSAQGRDVWLIAPDGTKQRPSGGEVAEYWGALAQQKADADMKRGVTMPVSYYASTVVAALLSSQKVATKPQSSGGEVVQWQKRHPLVKDGQWSNTSEPDAKWWRDNNHGWEARALCVATKPEPMTWQPIETAPKDGQCLVWVDTDDGGEVMKLSRNAKGEWLYEGEPTYSHSFYIKPTHWMPLPDAPGITSTSTKEPQ